MQDEPLTEAELEAILARCEAATPGPWYPHNTDDGFSANSLYIGTQPGTASMNGLYHDNHRGLAEGDKHQEPPAHLIAITLLQNPHLADVEDARWDENTLFIAHAREDIPRLVQEVRRLHELLNDENR